MIIFILLLVIAGMDRLVLVVRWRLSGNEDEFAWAFDRDHARIARMLHQLRRIDEFFFHGSVPR
jgi:hypothetical protein